MTTYLSMEFWGHRSSEAAAFILFLSHSNSGCLEIGKAKVIQKSHVELSLVELSCRKKQQKKVLTKKLLILGNRVLNKHMGHLGPIWYHSEPMFTIHQTSFLVGTFFAPSYNKMALVTFFDTKKIGIFLKAKTLT